MCISFSKLYTYAALISFYICANSRTKRLAFQRESAGGQETSVLKKQRPWCLAFQALNVSHASDFIGLPDWHPGFQTWEVRKTMSALGEATPVGNSVETPMGNPMNFWLIQWNLEVSWLENRVHPPKTATFIRKVMIIATHMLTNYDKLTCWKHFVKADRWWWYIW